MKRSEELKADTDAIAEEIKSLQAQKRVIDRRINRLMDDNRIKHSEIAMARRQEALDEISPV